MNQPFSSRRPIIGTMVWGVLPPNPLPTIGWAMAYAQSPCSCDSAKSYTSPNNACSFKRATAKSNASCSSGEGSGCCANGCARAASGGKASRRAHTRAMSAMAVMAVMTLRCE